MSEDNGGSKLAFFLAGLGIGGILALLFAPRSGKETRELIAQKTEEGRDYVTAKSQEIGKQVDEYAERVKTTAARGKERLSAAFDAGAQAWKEERQKAR